MEDSSHHYIILPVLMLVLLCLSAFFSATETSFSALNRIKLKNLAAKSKRARLTLRLLEVYDQVLSSVLIGNNIVNILVSSLATALFISIFGIRGVSYATLFMTAIILIFCEITPKTLAKESPEVTALRAAPLLRVFMLIFTPLNFLMTQWKKIIMKLFPVKDDRTTTGDELITYVEEVRQEGGINIKEEQMIKQAISFDHLKVSGIITARVDVEAVSCDAAAEEIDRKFTETGFSRLPVYKDNIDNITGIILLKDFYQEVMKGYKTPAQIIKPVVYVNKTIKLAKLFLVLQEKQAHMAIIVDEHGGTLGIVTVEDILEELVGEIWDEHDEKVEEIKKNADGSLKVMGFVNFIDILEAFEYTTEDKEKLEVPDTTVSNWMMETLGRLPRIGEKLTWHCLDIVVVRVFRHRIMEVKVYINKGSLL